MPRSAGSSRAWTWWSPGWCSCTGGGQASGTSPPTATWPTTAQWAASRDRGRSGPLDRGAGQAAPLGPRPVVDADAIAAEQLGQHEPGTARPVRTARALARRRNDTGYVALAA